MRRATIAFSSRSLALCSSCSPRWSSTAGSALRRIEPASATVLARWPSRRISKFGAGGQERRVAAADREHVAGRKRLPEQADDRLGRMLDRRPHLHLAGEHDLLGLSRADLLHRPRHGLLVV